MPSVNNIITPQAALLASSVGLAHLYPPDGVLSRKGAWRGAASPRHVTHVSAIISCDDNMRQSGSTVVAIMIIPALVGLHLIIPYCMASILTDCLPARPHASPPAAPPARS